MIALQGIRDKGQVKRGQKVLINGAGGGAGSFAIQFAKLYGAEVTGVDNTGKLDFMRSLGADHVIDYTRDDYTKNGRHYDLIIDVVAHRSVFAYKRALSPKGKYYCVGGSVARLIEVLVMGSLVSKTTGKSIGVLVVKPNARDLAYIAGLCTAGEITPTIDKCYPLSEVSDALRYLGENRAKGKVIINIGQG